MKIIYTNISPINSAYTNLNHIFYLKRQNPQKVYLCIWDNFVYEHPIFEKNLEPSQNKVQKLKENVEVLEKLMKHLKLDYKIIYLSEALSRLFKNSQYLASFEKILASIKIEELRKGLQLEYIPFGQISISRIHYIISDYLIALHLPEIFPELASTKPTHYLTSERFRIFYHKVDSSLRSNFQRYAPPTPIFVQKVPVIMNPKTEAIPRIEDSESKIYEIVKEHYKERKITHLELADFFAVLSEALKSFEFKGEEYSIEGILKKLKKADKETIVKAIANNLYCYLTKIQEIIQQESIKEPSQSMFIAETKVFEKVVKSLNPIKLKILQYCDGISTSLDISRKTGLNLSTVSTYFTYLKKQGLISDERKPKRLVNSIVIDIRNMSDRGDGSPS